MRGLYQAGWVGKGWTLSAGGAVARVRHPAGPGWDYFTLAAGGRSYTLVRGRPTGGNTYAWAGDFLDRWSWHAVDEQFARVEITSNAGAYTWTLTAKDGTRFVFGTALNTTDGTSVYVGQWLLDRSIDAYGNEVRYQYQIDAVNNGQLYHPTHYLRFIYWGHDGATPGTGASRYRVEFIAGERTSAPTSGVDASWDHFNNGTYQTLATRERYRLDTIAVEHRVPGGSWERIRHYSLSYYPASSSVSADGIRVAKRSTAAAVTTHYAFGVYEQEGSMLQTHYALGGQGVAVRSPSGGNFVDRDRLGSPQGFTRRSGGLQPIAPRGARPCHQHGVPYVS